MRTSARSPEASLSTCRRGCDLTAEHTATADVVVNRAWKLGVSLGKRGVMPKVCGGWRKCQTTAMPGGKLWSKMRLGAIVPVAEHDFSWSVAWFGGEQNLHKAKLDPVREIVSNGQLSRAWQIQKVKVVCHGQEKVVHF